MGLGSGIRKKPIPDPGSKGLKGTGSRIWIRNTALSLFNYLESCMFTSQNCCDSWSLLAKILAILLPLSAAKMASRFPYLTLLLNLTRALHPFFTFCYLAIVAVIFPVLVQSVLWTRS
jgi:hypothetical protein